MVETLVILHDDRVYGLVQIPLQNLELAIKAPRRRFSGKEVEADHHMLSACLEIAA